MTRGEAERLVRMGLVIYDDLTHRGYRAAPGVHRLTQAVAYLSRYAPPDPDACPTCGGPVVQPERGRRRVHCSSTCRNRAAKRARK